MFTALVIWVPPFLVTFIMGLLLGIIYCCSVLLLANILTFSAKFDTPSASDSSYLDSDVSNCVSNVLKHSKMLVAMV